MSAAVARMPQDWTDLDLEALRAELEKNQQDLLQAGHYGRKLLEERDNLKCELNALKENNTLLKKSLESQKEDSLRALQECKSVAGTRIAELEEELEKLEKSSSLRSDDACVSATEQIIRENEQLKEEISQLLKEHKDEIKVVEMKLEVREKESSLLKTELLNTGRQLEKLQEDKQELERSLNLKQHSCEQLSAELQIVKQEAEAWEYQCLCNEQLLKTQDNELGDTRDQLQQLQQEINSKENTASPTSSTPIIKRATSSLFDELSNQDPFSSQPPNTTDTHTQHDVVRLESCESIGSSSLSSSEAGIVDNCLRCMELQAGSVKLQEETEVIKKQLLAVIQEKIKLHEQVEAWQSDVEEMFRSKVQVELDNLANDRQKSRSKLRGLLKGSKVADSTKVKKLALKPSYTQ